MSGRRLPIYLVLDCSGSMSGAPIEAVNQGIKALVSELNLDPAAIETAYLSIITFDSNAQQVCPLTELSMFQIPTLTAGGGTDFDAALKLLRDCIDREVQKATSEKQKGDWKPLVFIMTDGQPYPNNWEQTAAKLKTEKPSPANIIACAAGADANENELKKMTDIVVKFNDLQPDTFKQFFKWMTQSIAKASESALVMADNQPINLPPPPPNITIVP